MDITHFKGKKTSDRTHGAPCIICGDTEDPVSEDGLCGWCQATVDIPNRADMERLALNWATHYSAVWMKRAFFAREAREDNRITPVEDTVYQVVPHGHTGELYLLGSHNDEIVSCLYVDDLTIEALYRLTLGIENNDLAYCESLIRNALAEDTEWAQHESWGRPRTSRDFLMEKQK